MAEAIGTSLGRLDIKATFLRSFGKDAIEPRFTFGYAVNAFKLECSLTIHTFLKGPSARYILEHVAIDCK